MKRLIFTVLVVASSAAAQSTSPVLGARSYTDRCSVCHGGDGNGSERGPAVFTFVATQPDAALAALVRVGRNAMPPQAVDDAEMANLIAYLRTLQPPRRRARRGPQPGRVTLENGTVLEGLILNQSMFDMQLRTADGKVHLLTRDGATYRETPIEPKENWPFYDGGYNANRYKALDQINTNNAGRLALQWFFPMPDAPRIEATPVVVDGIMYVTTLNQVNALDATTGRQIWQYSEPGNPGIISEAGLGANRGVAVAGDFVYFATDHAHLLAINRWTGERLWDVMIADYTKAQYSSTAAPMVVGDLVIAGVSGGEEGVRGFLDAYRVSDGKLVWRFWTIPLPGEPLSETWVGDALEHGCGATWMNGSYDPELDLLYWAVGNPCPDYNGDERLGDNLYTNSVLALRPKTGELVWYYQFTPHDTHDWDAQEPLILADEVFQGRPRKLLMQANRNGFFYVLDRTDGTFLLGEPFVRQTWAKGIDAKGRPIVLPNTDPTDEGVVVCPSAGGGTNWYSASYNPLSKLFYIKATESCATYKKDPEKFEMGRRFFGGTASGYGERKRSIRAIDPQTGKIAWDLPVSEGGRVSAGVLSTGGGLVFFGEDSGALVAADAKTGKVLWKTQLNQGWWASPMTYMVGGKQYVSLGGPAGFFTFALGE